MSEEADRHLGAGETQAEGLSWETRQRVVWRPHRAKTQVWPGPWGSAGSSKGGPKIERNKGKGERFRASSFRGQ